MAERLQKLLAHAGIGSRRASEQLIRDKRVTVNGKVAKLGDRAQAGTDKVAVDGVQIKFETPTYIMLNKPRNVLSSTVDELNEGRKTIRDLVNVPGHIYPIGRLDKQSLGLILLTNDGDLAHKLTHPRYGHEKVYRVLIKGFPPEHTLEQWRRGVMLEGKKTLPAKIKFIQRKEDACWIEIIMREGRKRQIRRVANLLGYEVRTLVRIKLGPLRLGDLPQGKWRHLTSKEVQKLKKVTEKAYHYQKRGGQGKNAGKSNHKSHKSRKKQRSRSKYP